MSKDNPLIEVSDGLWLSKSIVDEILDVADTYAAMEKARLNRLGEARKTGGLTRSRRTPLEPTGPA